MGRGGEKVLDPAAAEALLMARAMAATEPRGTIGGCEPLLLPLALSEKLGTLLFMESDIDGEPMDGEGRGGMGGLATGSWER